MRCLWFLSLALGAVLVLGGCGNDASSSGGGDGTGGAGEGSGRVDGGTEDPGAGTGTRDGGGTGGNGGSGGNGGTGGQGTGGNGTGGNGTGGNGTGGAGTGGTGTGGTGTPCEPTGDASDDCDGDDDDCDGTTDEGFEPASTSCGVGPCASTGSTSCVSGEVQDSCVAGTPASDANCNNVDDDCSGAADEDYVTATTSCGVGACARTGTRTCVSGGEVDSCVAGATTGSDDDCDDVNDDCDGATDEGFSSTPTTCGVGACASTGASTCTNGVPGDSCTPGATTGTDNDCDNVNDDCDGATDEAFPQATTCGVGACASTGTSTCANGVPGDTCTPGATTGTDNDCDNVNDDCDGATDEAFVAGPSTCGAGACASTGTRSCGAGGQFMDTCAPGSPTGTDNDCDNVNDDCDGATDEGFVGQGTTCGTGACASTGMTTCGAGGVTGDTCTPGSPTGTDNDCDNVNDDCDGATDEAFAQPTTCGAGACASSGTTTCTNGVPGDTCSPGPTTGTDNDCDNINDDCDGATDESFVGQGTTCGTGACASTGMTTCGAGGVPGDTCTPGAAAPDDATCDGENDDCDGLTDEDFVGCMDSGTTAACVNGQMQADEVCDDSVSCTMDACLMATGQCEYVPSDAACPADSFACTSAVCAPGPTADVNGCVVLRDDQVCQGADGAFCNGPEICDPNAPLHDAAGCIASLPQNVPCNPATDIDNVPCTDTVCIEDGGGAGHCDSTADHAFCGADGLVCNGLESCSPLNPVADLDGCVATAPIVCPPVPACALTSCTEPGVVCGRTTSPGFSCSDGDPCTTDSCNVDANPATDGCVHTPIVPCQGCQAPEDCADAFACTVDSCNAMNQCVHDATACECFQDSDCDDGEGCTIDSCDASGQCANTPDDAYCVGLDVEGLCDGPDICDPATSLDATGCVSVFDPPDCADALDCTADGCYPDQGCVNLPQDFYCEQTDPLACDGVAFCNENAPNNSNGGCENPPGFDPCPDDGVACTTETCAEPANQGGAPVCLVRPDTDFCLAQPGGCGTTCDPRVGCTRACTRATCQGKTYACGDCIDNDGDCRIDAGFDTACLGPCANNETTFHGDISGQNNAPCKMDCYFDQDTGAGNDDCYWDHGCDPVSLAPNYPPEGDNACEYDPDTNISGTSMSCAEAFVTQSVDCWDPAPGAGSGTTGTDYCGDLVPNGCDCFGCCDIPGVSYDVYLGSEFPNGDGSCTPTTLTDDTRCKRCTQLPACTNPCETCEICVGRPLPPECGCQVCPPNVQKCGAPCGGTCPAGFFCNTGCCTPVPQ